MDTTAKVKKNGSLLENADCLRRIFSYLSLRDRASSMLVCKSWSNLVRSTPLSPSKLDVSCHRTSPAQFHIRFAGRLHNLVYAPLIAEGVTVHILDADQHGRLRQLSGNPLDRDPERLEATRRSTDDFFHRFFSKYGYAISGLAFGGDLCDMVDLDAILNDFPTPVMSPVFFDDLSTLAYRNLSYISLRQVHIDGDTWTRLAEALESLAKPNGQLDALCLHGITTRDADEDALMRTALAIHGVDRFGCSALPSRLEDALGESSFVLETEMDRRRRSPLTELFLPLTQYALVALGRSNRQCVRIVQLAHDSVDLELNINNYMDAGVDAAVAEILHAAASRLRTLDLRVWLPQRYHRQGFQAPMVDILTELAPCTGTLREFRMYGDVYGLNNRTLDDLVRLLSSAPNFRRLSLGKVCAKRVRDFRPLGNLIDLERLSLSFCTRMDDDQLKDVLGRLINLRRLWLFELNRITHASLLPVMRRLEAVEIIKCESFDSYSFACDFLDDRERNGACAIEDNLEFVKVGGWQRPDLRRLNRSRDRFERLGIRVDVDFRRCEVVFILKNHSKWIGVKSIRPPWYTCPYCEAELER